MKKAFTLVEVLCVLALIALGWLWVPGLFQSAATTPSTQFLTQFPLLHARARMEALTRQQPVAFALRSDGLQMAVLTSSSGNVTVLSQVSLSSNVVFNVALSSVAGNPGICTLLPDGDRLWRVWWYTPAGAPLQSGGTLVFSLPGRVYRWQIATEGALLVL